MKRFNKAKAHRAVVLATAVFSVLAMPPCSNAALPDGVPGAWCDLNTPTHCYTYQDADSISQFDFAGSESAFQRDSTKIVSSNSQGCSIINGSGDLHPVHNAASCTRVSGHRRVYYFEHYHSYNTHAMLEATWVVFVTAGGVTHNFSPSSNGQVLLFPQNDAIDCFGYLITDQGPWHLKPDAPADVFTACADKEEKPSGTEPLPDTTTNPDEPKPVVQEKGTCPVVAVAKKGRVAVTRDGLSCFAARTTIAKYLRSGKAPAGYVCVSIRSKKIVTGKCVASGAARSKSATVVGRYRLP